MSNISILIPACNEQGNLSFSLKSCSFADRVVVLDSGSTDKTEEIARAYRAQVVYHPWEGYAKQKNWALDNLPFETAWIFVLDADEEITSPLREELVAISTGKVRTDKAGFYVNRFLVWQGKEIRHCGYYPSWNLRFFRKGKAHYEERDVHEHMIVNGPVGYLRGEMRHEDRRGRDYVWQKHFRYAELEAGEMVKIITRHAKVGIKPSLFGNALERRRAVKERMWPYLPARWLFRFLYMYVLEKGFLDGAAGLDLCLFMARYEKEIARKFTELRTALAI